MISMGFAASSAYSSFAISARCSASEGNISIESCVISGAAVKIFFCATRYSFIIFHLI
jgi:hypothetical protein